MIKQLMSNTSYIIVCEATCFGPYVASHTIKYDVSEVSCFIILILNLNTSGCLQSNFRIPYGRRILPSTDMAT